MSKKAKYSSYTSTSGSRAQTVITVLAAAAVIVILIAIGTNFFSELREVEGEVRSTREIVDESLALLSSSAEVIGSSGVDLDEIRDTVSSSVKDTISVWTDDVRGELSRYAAELNETVSSNSHSSDSAEGTVAYDSSESARVFFEKACDGSSDNRELYYLAAIRQDPTNADYCRAYISYLDEISAPASSYYTLGSLVESAILSSSYSDTEDLVEVYNYIVDNCLTVTVEDNSSELVEERDRDLEKLSSDFDTLWTSAPDLSCEEFSALAETIGEEYRELSEYVGSDISGKYELLSSTVEVLDSLMATVECIERLQTVSDSDFLYSYAYVASAFDSAISSIVLLDTSFYGVFSSLVEDAGNRIKSGTAALDSRYDSLLFSDIAARGRKALTSITNRGTVAITTAARYNTVKAEYEDIVNEYSVAQSRTRGSDTAISLMETISGILADINTAIYKYQYEAYQLWAASLMQTIKTKVEKARNAEKLETLYREGYYTISTSLLIPKLQTLYASLYEDSYTKNSAKTDAVLISLYGVDVKSLGEV